MKPQPAQANDTPERNAGRAQPPSKSGDYDALWEHYQTLNADALFRYSAARLAYLVGRLGRPPQRVLNVGVGNGTFELLASKRGHEVYAVDPSAASIARVRDLVGLADRAVAGRAEHLPFPDGLFDAVVVSEVMEHLADGVLEAAVGEFARVLRDGGRLLGTVPAREVLAEQLVVCPACGSAFHRWGHQQSFDIARMRALLHEGFPTVAVRERLFISWPQLNLKGKIGGLARLVLFWLGDRGPHNTLVFTASAGS